jgi:hypothetical protein
LFSNNSTPCMLQSVTVPLLAAANQASFQNLIQEIEINYLYAKSADKDFIVVRARQDHERQGRLFAELLYSQAGELEPGR